MYLFNLHLFYNLKYLLLQKKKIDIFLFIYLYINNNKYLIVIIFNTLFIR